MSFSFLKENILSRCEIKCKSMNTPMDMNFKKLCGEAAGPDLENPFEYRQLIRTLMLLVNYRPNICFAVNTLSQYMINSSHVHCIFAKHVLIYLHGTINIGLKI